MEHLWNIMSKPTCYYCREIGHTVTECVRVPPCTVCGKKGHKSNQCTYYVHKTAGKLYTQPKTAAKDVERKPKNSYAILNTKENSVKNVVETSEHMDWWEEMKDDWSFMK